MFFFFFKGSDFWETWLGNFGFGCSWFFLVWFWFFKVKTQLGFCFCCQDCSLFGAKDLLGVKAVFSVWDRGYWGGYLWVSQKLSAVVEVLKSLYSEKMACMKLGSKTDAFQRQGQAWYVIQSVCVSVMLHFLWCIYEIYWLLEVTYFYFYHPFFVFLVSLNLILLDKKSTLFYR